LQIVELYIGQPIDGIDSVPGYYQDRDSESYRERWKERAHTTAIQIANDHARCGRQEGPKAQALDEAGMKANRWFRAHGFGRSQGYRSPDSRKSSQTGRRGTDCGCDQHDSQIGMKMQRWKTKIACK
jgi:hypothetical protein